MARRVFFSFEYSNDVQRAMVVRNSWVVPGKEAAGFVDAAEFERLARTSETVVKQWILRQLRGTSVTVVLVGARTCSSKWVAYEIEQSKALGNGLLGVDISKVKSFAGQSSELCGQLPKGYPFYRWNRDEGAKNLGAWIEAAARAAGR